MTLSPGPLVPQLLVRARLDNLPLNSSQLCQSMHFGFYCREGWKETCLSVPNQVWGYVGLGLGTWGEGGMGQGMKAYKGTFLS